MKFVPLYSLFPILVLLPFIFIDQSGLIKKKKYLADNTEDERRHYKLTPSLTVWAQT